jgi:hypothetical protein
VILLDPEPVVALCDPRDGLNRAALRDLDRVSREPLVLCTPVLTEVCFLLPRASSGLASNGCSRNSPSAPTGSTISAALARGLRWMVEYQDHDPDRTDGYLAVVSGKERRFKLWTYDLTVRRFRWSRAGPER